MYKTEIQFLQAFRAGELLAYKALFDLNFKGCMCEAKRILNDETAAESVSMTVFSDCWEKRDGFYSLESLLFFLYKNVRSESLKLKYDI